MQWVVPWIRRSPTKEAKKGTHAARLLKQSDQSNYDSPLLECGLIGRSDDHRTQTTLKLAGCFDDKKYLRCAAFVNQVYMSNKCSNEEQP